MSDWKTKRERKHLMVSASQIETFQLCKRKWWLERVRRLPTGTQAGHFVFGTILHAVCERYLRADDQGRDRTTGRAVDLYPEGWHTHTEDGVTHTINAEEQRIIRALIEKAIEEGVLVRAPGRAVERKFRRSLIKTDHAHVEIMGFVDLSYPGGVEDHKTTKSLRYAKTPKTLRENTQIKIYAMQAILDCIENDIPVPERFKLRHNIFVKDPENLLVKQVEVIVSRQEIEEFYLEVEQAGAEMAKWRAEADQWNDLPDPDTGERACNAYGGCLFRSICTGKESEQGFEDRMNFADRMAKQVEQQAQLTVKGKKMGVFADKFKKDMPKAEPKAEPVPKPEPEPVGDRDFPSPPWVNPDCKACKDNEVPGFNSTGAPCQVCNVSASKRGVPSSGMFVISVADDNIAWGLKPEAEEKARELGYMDDGGEIEIEPKAPKAGRSATEVAEPKPKTEPVFEGEPKKRKPGRPKKELNTTDPEPLHEEDDGPVSIEDVVRGSTAKTVGRPKKGFVLCCGTVPVNGVNTSGKGGFVVHRLDQILERLGEEMARVSGVESYYDLDVWDRRAKMAKHAGSLCEQFGSGDFVCCPRNPSPDLKSLMDAVRPHSGIEIVAWE